MSLKMRISRAKKSSKKGKKRIDKKGNYIVEAAIVLPIFMISMIAMISIIALYACIEKSNYKLANEMRYESVKASYAGSGMLFAGKLGKRIEESDENIDKLTINSYKYKDNMADIDQVIYLNYNMRMKVKNPLNIASRADYELSLMSRAYVGKYGDIDPMSAEEFAGDASEPVFIFPNRGEKYHNKACSFMRASYTSTSLTPAIKSKYQSCPVCKSSHAGIGSAVYYFPDYGDSYHLSGCSVLERKYIEMEKKHAIKRGYTACSKCGG